MPQDFSNVLQALATIPGLDPSAVFGPVASLFRPKQDRFLTAIEHTAGMRLFQIAVRDDQVAAVIVDYLKQNHVGRVSLIPVEQLRALVEEPQMPEDPRGFPLLRCIEFEDAVRPVMVSIFGRTLLCENLEAAANVARELNVNCVTLAGEKVNKRGAMRGGYLDPRGSRLRLWRSFQQRDEKVAFLVAAQGRSAASKLRKTRESRSWSRFIRFGLCPLLPPARIGPADARNPDHIHCQNRELDALNAPGGGARADRSGAAPFGATGRAELDDGRNGRDAGDHSRADFAPGSGIADSAASHE